MVAAPGLLAVSRRRREIDHRVRIAAMEQALELGLPELAAAFDRSSDSSEVVEVAVREVTLKLGLSEEDRDAIRFAVTAGVISGQLLAVVRPR